MGVKAAIQAFGRAEDLKQSILKCQQQDFISPNIISMLKQLQQLYRHILIVDLQYGLDKKVEQDLWNVGFKIMITALQDILRDKKSEHKNEASALLNWGLSGASGFYLTLLQETWGANKFNTESINGLTFLAQQCLVHLGDLSRYQNYKQEAQNYYKHAIKIAPDCGQAYNQVAILDTVTDPISALKAASLYCRAFGAPQSFAPAHKNLLRLLDEYKTFVPTQNVSLQSVDDYFGMFLQQICHILNHSVIYSNISISSENNITDCQYIQMFVLVLYCFDRLLDTRICKDNELSKDEKCTKEILLNLLIIPFSASNVDHPALKSVYLTLSWLEQNSSLLQSSTIEGKSYIWSNIADLLNSLPTDCHQINPKGGNEMPLPEDLELSGYVPLHSLIDNSPVNKIASNTERFSRILQKGLWLVTQTDHLSVRSDDNGIYKFMSNSTTKVTSTSAIMTNVNTQDSLNKIDKKPSQLIKPKRTNVAMQAILQKANQIDVNAAKSAPVIANHNFFDLPKSTADTTSQKSISPLQILNNEGSQSSDKSTSLKAASDDNIILPSKSDFFFKQTSHPDPPQPPLNWILDIDTTKNNQLQQGHNSLFSNSMFPNQLISNTTCTSPFQCNINPWSASGSYSLFSGPSPLEKLLQDQKKKGENQT